MHTPRRDVVAAAVAEGPPSPSLAARRPRTTAKHVCLLSPTPRAPAALKGLQERLHRTPPPSFRTPRRPLNETLCRTEESTPSRTYSGECDDDDVTSLSARFEGELPTAVLLGGQAGEGCSSSRRMTHCPDGAALTTSALCRGSLVPCVSDGCDGAHTLIDPATTLRSPHSFCGFTCVANDAGVTTHHDHDHDQQQQQIQKQQLAVEGCSSPHTPLASIFGCPTAHTPHYTSVPATPQKSARRPPTRQLTPATHQRGVSLHNISAESGDFSAALPYPTHSDYLAPNRNPWSPYYSYADVVAAVDAQAVRMLDEMSQPLHSSLCTSFKGGGGGGSEALSSNGCSNMRYHDSDIITSTQVEVWCSTRGACSSESEDNDSSCRSRSSSPCCFPPVSRLYAERDATEPGRCGMGESILHVQAEERSSHTTPKHLTHQASLEVSSPSYLRCTRSFHNLQDCECEQGSAPASTSHPKCTPQWSVSHCAPRPAPLFFVSPDGVNVDALPDALDSPKVLPNDAHSSGASSISFCGSEERAMLRMSVEDGREEEADDDDDEEEEEELEPGDRFRLHHRYQFLHWLPWRNSHGFVPIHLDRNGAVWLATHRTDGLPYAVKEVLPAHQSALPTELECLTLGNAPVTSLQQQAADHIVRYYTVSPYRVVSDGPQEVTAFLLQTEYFLMGNVMEWALDPHSLRGTPYTLPPESFWCGALEHGLLALEALHATRIVHGNPLPFNLFIFSRGHFKLGSFGSAVKSPEVYPSGTPASLLPPSNDDGVRWTPYEVDVYVFARGILQLLSDCILKRETCLGGGCEGRSNGAPLASDDCISFAAFREGCTKGHHELSDHLWHVLQSALREKSIPLVLKMLHAPSRAIWGVRCLLKAEYLRLLRRKHQLQLALRACSERKLGDGKVQQGAMHDLMTAGHPGHHSAHPAWCSHGSASSSWPEMPLRRQLMAAQHPLLALSIPPRSTSSITCQPPSLCTFGQCKSSSGVGQCYKGDEPPRSMRCASRDERHGRSTSAVLQPSECRCDGNGDPMPHLAEVCDSLFGVLPSAAWTHYNCLRNGRCSATQFPSCDGSVATSAPNWPGGSDALRTREANRIKAARPLVHPHEEDEGMFWTLRCIMMVMRWPHEPHLSFAASLVWKVSSNGARSVSWRAMRPFTSLE